ncbi:hypothetical protein V5799_005629 [Amblyomma americanum]|uniref:Uncharacterized protein n=1 Tax=Amblyomma americanum TaxID=6943 RepID=A0AAQ4DYP7_AMBAM
MMASRKAKMLIAGDAEASEGLKTARCIDLATAWFRPVLYYMTDTEFFTAEKKRAVNSFLHGVTLQMQSSLKAITWIDERTRRIMERKLRDLRVLAWLELLQNSAAPGLDQSSGAFSNFWEDPKKQEFLENWIAAASQRLRENGAGRLLHEEKYSLASPHPGVLYGYLSDRETVPHAAIAQPLFHFQKETGVLRPASFGGLVTAFLDTPIRMFDLQPLRCRRAKRVDHSQASQHRARGPCHAIDRRQRDWCAAVHTTVARLEPFLSNLNGYPLSKTILSAFNASGIHAYCRVIISSHRYLVAADWLLGKFGRRQLLENIAWWFTQICALMASLKARVLIADDVAGSEVLKAARYIDLTTAWFGLALYNATGTEYLPADRRRTVDSFLHGVNLKTQSSLKATTWIDKRTRRIMERSLRDLRVVAWLEQLQSSADPGLDQSSGVFSNFWEDPKKSTIARHLSIERVVLATLSTGVNETGRAAVHTTVARLEPLLKKLNGYPLPKAILFAFNASGIQAHSRVYISSRGYLVSADWILGKFGRRQLLHPFAWSFALICAVMASRKARVLIAGDGKGSEVLNTARCIDLSTAWFGPALYYTTDTWYFTAEKRRAVNSFLHGVIVQTQSSLKVMTWIDERKRRIMER